MGVSIGSIVPKKEIELIELSGKKIALSNTSATSQVLLKLILTHGYGIEPKYTISQPDLTNMLSVADAALLIGDIALKHYIDAKDYYLYDLGLEWKKLTGKRMVYAVWAVRRRFAETKNELCEKVFETFRKSMDYSMEHLTEIVEYAAKWEPFSPSFLTDYFKSLRFDFGDDYQEGLLLFYKLAEEIGELKTVPALEFINLRSGIRT